MRWCGAASSRPSRSAAAVAEVETTELENYIQRMYAQTRAAIDADEFSDAET